jgi:LuxR family transcriptional regulator, maltose regulon positive regulatory protein
VCDAPALVQTWRTLVQAEIDLARNLPGAAREHLQPLIGRTDSSAGRVRACMARVQLACGDARNAEAILSSVRQSDNPVVAVEAWLLSALVADRARADHRALTCLGRALALAEPTGIRRPFVVLRQPRLEARLRHRQQFADGSGRFLGTLLDDAQPSDHRTSPRTPPGGPLTDREQVVLMHLETLMTQSEIAGALNISVNTVKAHVRSLHRKLDVAKKRDAVNRARDLGLL